MHDKCEYQRVDDIELKIYHKQKPQQRMAIMHILSMELVHALALLPPSPSPLPLAADDAAALPVTLLNVATLLLPLLPIALRQLPAAEEWELQNESYVSKVVFCELVPTDVTGPGAVGMSNVLLDDDDVDVDVDDEDGRKDEDVSGVFGGGCVDIAGGGFCGGAGAGECGRLDVDGGEDDGGGTGAGVDAGLDVGAVGKAVWGIGGKVESGADRSDVCITAGV